MPAFGSGEHRRESMSHLYSKECVRNTEMVVSTELDYIASKKRRKNPKSAIIFTLIHWLQHF